MSTPNDSNQVITTMIYRYCELFDTGQFDEWVQLFVRGRWNGGPPGPERLRRLLDKMVILYEGRPGTQHLTTNLLIEVDEEAGNATASSYVTVLQQTPTTPMRPIFGGRYKDQFERADGQWEWRDRTIIADLTGDLSQHLRGPGPGMNSTPTAR